MNQREPSAQNFHKNLVLKGKFHTYRETKSERDITQNNISRKTIFPSTKQNTAYKNLHYEGNLKASLSAALSNQDTCLEGFEGTDRRLESFIKGSLIQVN
jgi:hypothetical protein